jgi:hypothetical protein
MKKLFMLLLAGLLIFVSIGECAPSKTVPIGMAIEFMDHAACAYISQDKGWFEEEGLNFTSYESYVTGMALASALARGDIQVAYICLVPAINVYANAKVPIKIVAGTHKYDYDLVEVKCGDISLVVSSEREEIKKVAILPEDIYISDTKPPGPDVNRVKGRLIEIEESSSTVCSTVVTGKNSLRAKLPQEIFTSMSLNTGDDVWLILALRKLKIITDGE